MEKSVTKTALWLTIVAIMFAIAWKIDTLEEKERQYKEYFTATEGVLDQIPNVILDSILVTDLGFDYIEARSKVSK